ncbi:uncharacterized protein LOC115415371 isoform X2 [Sphaeramia orbicularis]|uniref:uncharacterized protein LOC115415371 isoform X2 n=1 Tax=Sphaeramia orbicularis TaxID=375764 RepID=UPI00117CD7E8|nr:uncharacterized protein LOC115415371 isoform X2 [Sphaeramia orbicularis]
MRTSQRRRQTMGEFMWILLCMIFLQLTDVNGNNISVFVQNGNDVTLPCMNVISGQHRCEKTTWTFKASVRESAVELIKNGKVKESVLNRSDRMNITGDCSLLINKVTFSSAGQYYCKQSHESKEHNDDAEVHLSVVTMTERNDSNVQFICSVWAQKKCEHTVKWLYDGEVMNSVTKDSKISYICLASVTLDNKPINYELLECEVTDADSKKVHRFPFKSPVQETGEDETKPTTTASTTTEDPVFFIRLIIVCVGLTGLSLTACVLPRWMNRKRNTTQISQNEVVMSHRVVEASAASADPDVTYENQQNT